MEVQRGWGRQMWPRERESALREWLCHLQFTHTLRGMSTGRNHGCWRCLSQGKQVTVLIRPGLKRKAGDDDGAWRGSDLHPASPRAVVQGSRRLTRVRAPQARAKTGASNARVYCQTLDCLSFVLLLLEGPSSKSIVIQSSRTRGHCGIPPPSISMLHPTRLLTEPGVPLPSSPISLCASLPPLSSHPP